MNLNYLGANDMAVELVERPEGGKITVNGPKADVTVEAATSLEVSSTNAKTTALNAARGYLTKPGISGQSGPYPVDAEGNQLVDQTKGLPDGFRYRQDFTIQEGM